MSTTCEKCGQALPQDKNPVGRPKSTMSFTERKREYNRRYYDKVRSRRQAIEETPTVEQVVEEAVQPVEEAVRPEEAVQKRGRGRPRKTT